MEYLQLIVRHHRHHDSSIQLVPQTAAAFTQHDVSKLIRYKCALKQCHKLESPDIWKV